MTPAAQIVSLGAAAGPTDEAAAAVAAALAATGLPATTRVVIDADGPALERALAADVAVTVVLVDAADAAGELVSRAVARVGGVDLDEGGPRRPRGAVVWTAPGAPPAWALDARRRAFVVLPRDAPLQPLLAAHLPPFVRAKLGGRRLALRTLRTAGASRAEITDRLSPWLGQAPAQDPAEVTVVPADGESWVRLRAEAATAAEAAEALVAAEARIAAVLGDDCYGRDDDTLEQVVGRLLADRRLTLAIAESCTGGLLGHRLTNVAGSSAYFERGVVVYSNRAKEELLGVPAEVLKAHGAVSAPCAEAMARGICRVSGSDCGLAVTGIAGPDGGTPTKPVGTVFVGCAVQGQVSAHHFHFAGSRASVKWQSAQMALDLLRRRLLRWQKASP